MTFAQAYRAGLRSWAPLLVLNLMWLACGLLAYLVVLLAMLVIVLFASIVAVASQAAAIAVGGLIGLVALLALAVGGSAVAVAVYVSYLTVVVERAGFAAAFTTALTRVLAHAFRRSALAGLTVFAISLGVAVIGFVAQALTFVVLHSAPVGIAFSAVIGIVVTLLISMFMIVMYYDLLVRTEGFDLRAALAAEAAVPAPPPG